MVITPFISDDLMRKLNHNKRIRTIIFFKKIWLGKARILSFFLNWSIQSALFCVFSFYLFFPVLSNGIFLSSHPRLSLIMILEFWPVLRSRYTLSYNNVFYKNIEAEICEILRIL